MKKVLYVFGGPEFHATEACGQILADILKRDGRFELEMTRDFDTLAALPGGQYAAVVLYATGFVDDLTPAREPGLLDFVTGGGGFVGVHAAADCFRGNRNFVDMLGGEFVWHPEQHEFKVEMVKRDHYLTTRVPDFSVFDEMYHLQSFDPARVTVLAQTQYQGVQHAMAYVRDYGAGRVAYLANGHTPQAWKHPEFRKLLLRAVAWSAGADLPTKTIRAGLLGYGPLFNMGKGHAGWINATPGMQTVAMCDAVPARVEAAKAEIPGLRGYYTRLDDMLALPDLDLVVNILPHNLHAPTTLQALQAGKHVVQEKPFCLTVAEADAMIDLAHAHGLMLSLFHNRRWDGDYLTMRETRWVIHQHINAPEHGMGVIEKFNQSLAVSNITRGGKHLHTQCGQLCAGLFQGLGAPCADGDICAFAGEFQCNGLANTFACAGDNNALALESEIHVFSSVCVGRQVPQLKINTPSA